MESANSCPADVVQGPSSWFEMRSYRLRPSLTAKEEELLESFWRLPQGKQLAILATIKALIEK